MKITDVRIRKITQEGKMKAIVSITFNDEFVVHDIKIIDGQNGLFVAMPSKKIGDTQFRDVAHPIKSETREKIQDAIFAEYEKVLELKEEEEAEEVVEYQEEYQELDPEEEKSLVLKGEDALVSQE